MTCDQLVSTCVRIRARAKSTQVILSPRKSTQVGSQTKGTFNACRKRALTCYLRLSPFGFIRSFADLELDVFVESDTPLHNQSPSLQAEKATHT